MTEPTSTQPILEVVNLGFAYPDQPLLFDHLSARFYPGVTLLYGDSGTGKTTLLELLAGQLPAGTSSGDRRSGRFTLVGVDLDQDADTYRNQLYWQRPASDAFDALTARQYAAEVADEAGRRPALQAPSDRASEQAVRSLAVFDDAAWERHLEGFGLLPHAHKPLYMLSTGSKRKVWMAVGLASRRPLLLLDEPSAALDAASIAYLHRVLGECAADTERAVVVASYSRLESIALSGLIELPSSG
ncbi:MAG: transporter related protein [Rhizobacter sp.]|nr:transporter related protein [Rhizobacter sp.]